MQFGTNAMIKFIEIYHVQKRKNDIYYPKLHWFHLLDSFLMTRLNQGLLR